MDLTVLTPHPVDMSRPPIDTHGTRPPRQTEPASKMLLAGFLAIVVIVLVLVLLL